MSWKEYEINDSDIAEWLPWGGLVRPHVLKNKDHSFLGIIEYTPYKPSENKKINYHHYKNGWSIWSEKQHCSGEDHYFLAVSWNPFCKENFINNTLDFPIEVKEAANYFSKEMQNLHHAINAITSCNLVEYQEVLNFLAFTLSLGENQVIMPSIPLYLDVLLSKNLKVEFFENELSINKNEVLIITLPSIPNMSIMNILYEAFEKYNYRHVQRLLVFDKEAAKEDLDEYISNWCAGRKSLRKNMVANIISNLNGYYTASFIFNLPESSYAGVRNYCQEVLNILEIPYIFEHYNLKDVWWGSLPAIFRANINAPIVGFSCIDDLLSRSLNEGKEFDV